MYLPSKLTKDVRAFFPPLFNFFRVRLNVLVRAPGGTRIPGWESLSYPDDGRSRPHETFIHVCQTNCFTPSPSPPTSELFSYPKKQKN